MWLRRKVNLKRPLLIAVALLLLVPSFLPVEAYVAVDTSVNDDRALLINTQNHIGRDSNGRYWILYYNGTCTAASYSTTLTTWTKLSTCGPASFLDGYYGLSFKIVGTTVYTVGQYVSGPNYYLRYWNGTISGTSITWNTTGVNIVFTASRWGAPSLDIGSDGKIWVSTVLATVPDFRAYYSSNGGKTWASSDNDEASPLYLGSIISPMASGKMMAVYHSYSIPPNSLQYSIWTGTWSAAAGVSGGSLPNDEGSFDLTADVNNADIQYAVWLDDTAGYVVRFRRYNSGWGTIENVTGLVDSTSYPSISFNSFDNSTVVSWIQSDTLFTRTRSSAGVWGSITSVDSMILVNVISPKDLSATNRDMGSNLVFAFVTGNAAPFNLTISRITYTTTTTATVTTLTTQTTTADTIVDAVANQFAAIMENLFPALIIILIFVYLAYKAGASGEVLAYVFVITLVLTSFIGLMPWWITLIVSVIMIAILLNYRQRGGGVQPA